MENFDYGRLIVTALAIIYAYLYYKEIGVLQSFRHKSSKRIVEKHFGAHKPDSDAVTDNLRDIYDTIVQENNLKRILNSRPDLSFITKASCSNEAAYKAWFNSLTPDQLQAYARAEVMLPALISIAEAHFDGMIGTDADASLPFLIVNNVLNSIANGSTKKQTT